MKNRIALLLGVAIIAMGTAGCEKKATGQVAAVVNGEEISLQEINAELEGTRLPENVDKKMVTREVLQRVIDRKLLVQQAREQGLDKSPEYLTQQRRLNENLLVGLLGKQAANSVKIPPAGEVDKFIAENPSMFGSRTRYSLDQIQFDPPADQSKLKPLEQAHSMAEVAQVLDAGGIQYQRGKGVLDSATVPAPVMKQILSLPRTEPFIVPAQGKIVASLIVGEEAVPMPPETTRPAATEMLRRKGLMDTTEKQVKAARTAAKIEYQPGYEPPAPPKPAAKPAAAPAKT